MNNNNFLKKTLDGELIRACKFQEKVKFNFDLNRLFN